MQFSTMFLANFICVQHYWNGRMVLLLSDSTVYGYSGCLVLRCSRSRACFPHFCSLEEMSDHGLFDLGDFPACAGSRRFFFYYTMYYLVSNELTLAAIKGLESFKNRIWNCTWNCIYCYHSEKMVLYSKLAKKRCGEGIHCTMRK